MTRRRENHLFRIVSMAVIISMTLSMIMPAIEFAYAQDELPPAEETEPGEVVASEEESSDGEDTSPEGDSIDHGDAEPGGEAETDGNEEGLTEEGADAEEVEPAVEGDDASAESDAESGEVADAEEGMDESDGGSVETDETAASDEGGASSEESDVETDEAARTEEGAGESAENEVDTAETDATDAGEAEILDETEVDAREVEAAGEVEAVEDSLEEDSAAAEVPLLQEVPDGVEVVVVNEEGEVEPLATVESAEILANPDPQFCPAGLPMGDPGCGAVHDNMADAIEDARIAAESGTSGTIYVEPNPEGWEGFILDGFSWNTSLTIQGLTDPNNDPDPVEFNTRVDVIENMFNDLLFQNLIFSEGFLAVGNSADLTLENVLAGMSNEFDGLPAAITIVGHEGDVTLDAVTADHDPEQGVQGGALIDNSVGEEGVPGDVTIINSSFNTISRDIFRRNGVDGDQHSGPSLNIVSSGDVSLDGVQASNNPGGGALIETRAYAPVLGLNEDAVCQSPLGFTCMDTNGDQKPDELDQQFFCQIFSGWCQNDVIDEGQVCNVVDPQLCQVRAARVNVQNSYFDYNALGAVPNGMGVPPGLEIQSLGEVDLLNVSAQGNPGGGTRIDNRSLPGMEVDTLAFCGELGHPYCLSPGELDVSAFCFDFGGEGLCHGPFLDIWVFCNASEFGEYCRETMPEDVPPADATIIESNFDFVPYFDVHVFCESMPEELCLGPGEIDYQVFCTLPPFGQFCTAPDEIDFTAYCDGKGKRPGCFYSESFGSGLDIASHGDVTLLDVEASGNAAEGVNINNRGPELYTYTYERGEGLRVIDPGFDFDDISQSGIELLNPTDNGYVEVPIGFPFSYFGAVYESIFVYSDGFLSVFPDMPAAGWSWQSSPLPNPTDNFDGIIAGYWGALNPQFGGAIYFETKDAGDQDEGDSVFIVQYDLVSQYDQNAQPVTMQFKFFQATGDIEVHYISAGPASSYPDRSAGIENQDGSYGLYYYYGQDGLEPNTAVGYSTLYRVLDVIGRLPGGDVFIQGGTFDENGRGLNVMSDGDITLENVSASNNYGGGAWLDNKFFDFQPEYQINQQAVCAHPLWPGGTCQDTNNDQIPDTIDQAAFCAIDPFDVCNDGQIDVVDFCQGAPRGACSGGLPGNVDISNSHFDNNGRQREEGPPGLEVQSYGDVSLSDVTALNNAWGGARIDNTSLGGGGPVDINVIDFCQFYEGQYCLEIDEINPHAICDENPHMCNQEGIMLDEFCNSPFGEFCIFDGGDEFFDLPQADVTITNSVFDFNSTTLFIPRLFCREYKGPGDLCEGPNLNWPAFRNRFRQFFNPGFNRDAYCASGRPGCYETQSWGFGLDILTFGNVDLTDVGASGHGYSGLKIGDWERDIRADNVFIDPSKFDNNGYNSDGWGGGLDVLARGEITLLDVTASGNAWYGAYLDNQWYEPQLEIDQLAFCADPRTPPPMCADTDLIPGPDTIVEPVFCALTPFCDGGLEIIVEFFCEEGPGEYCQMSQPADVTVTNSIFDDNGSSWSNGGPPGLGIYSFGDVTLNRVAARDNPWGGVFIENVFRFEGCQNGDCDCDCEPDEDCECPQVEELHLAFEGPPLSPGDVTINTGNFDYNSSSVFWGKNFCKETGGKLCKGGRVSFKDLCKHQVFGAYCSQQAGFDRDGYCADPRDLPGCVETRSFGTGVEILSEGDVTLQNVGSSGHGQFGLKIGDDWDRMILPDNVFIDPSTFNNNGYFSEGPGGGVYVVALGDITLLDVTASGNADFGAYLDNKWYQPELEINQEIYCQFRPELCVDSNSDRIPDTIFEPLFCQATPFCAGGNEIIVEFFCFEGPGEFCQMSAPGDVSVSNSSFNANGHFSPEAWQGLEIYSYGHVSLNRVAAFDNPGGGVFIDNSWDMFRGCEGPCEDDFLGARFPLFRNDRGYEPGDVTVTSGFFDYRLQPTFDGDVYCDFSKGSPACKGAKFNPLAFCKSERYGEHCYKTPRGVKIDPEGLCIDDGWVPGCNLTYGTGLEIYTQGDVTLTNVHASGHGHFGLLIGGDKREGESLAGNVFIDPSTFNNNGYFSDWGGGIQVNASGDITLLDVTASGNANFGAILDNRFLYGELQLDENAFCNDAELMRYCSPDGFEVRAWCSGPRAGCLARDEFDLGLFCDEGYGEFCLVQSSVPGNVSVTDSSFNTNGWEDFENPPGLMIFSYGDVTLDGVNANQNPWGGAFIDNTWRGCLNGDCPDAFGNVFITNSNFNFKGSFDGNLFCEQYGEPTRICGQLGNRFNYQAFCSDKFYGQFCSPQGGVDLGSYCYSKKPQPGCRVGWGTGLDIMSHGDVTLVDVFANGNANGGALIDNRGPEVVTYVEGDTYHITDPGFDFVDISGSGLPIFLDDDDVSAPLRLGFDFDYFGMPYSEIYVSSNGFLTVLPDQDDGCCSPDEIPDADDPNGIIAAWWEDLNPEDGGMIFYETIGQPGNQTFILQFTDLPHYSGPEVTFQIKIFESTSNIEVHYLNAPSNGDDHLAGIENQDGSDGYTFYFGDQSLPPELAVGYYPDAMEEWTRLRGGDVLIQGGSFNGNDVGLDVTSDGDVTLEGVDASFNRTSGARIDNQHYDYEPVLLLDPEEVCQARPGLCERGTDNLNVGLFCTAAPRFCSDGAIDHDAVCRAQPDLCHVRPGNVTITDSVFEFNGGLGEGGPAGLSVWSYGDVYLENVSALQNVWGGTYINNTNLPGWQIDQQDFCNNVGGPPPLCHENGTINEAYFCGPYMDGIFCHENNTIDTQWFCEGEYGDFCFFADPYELPMADVTVLGSHFDFVPSFNRQTFCDDSREPSRICGGGRFNEQLFCNHPEFGQYCGPRGVIDAVALCSDNPGLPGCTVSWGVGLNIQTEGTVDIMNSSASGHGEMGLKIGGKTENVMVRADDVSIDPSNFDNNGYTYRGWGGGMDVWARGDITLEQVSASGNASFGAYLNNAWWPFEMGLNHEALCSHPEFGQYCLDETEFMPTAWCDQTWQGPGCAPKGFDAEAFCDEFGGYYCTREYTPGYQPGVVNIFSSQFNNNGWVHDEVPPALIVYSYGAVNLDNVDTLDNPGGGGYIENYFDDAGQIGKGTQYYVGDPGFDFVDISGSGLPVFLDDDDVSAPLRLGFDFDYFGMPYSEIYVSSNGFLTVLPDQDDGCCSPDEIPDADDPNGIIAAWWEDLNPEDGGMIFYETIGQPGNQTFILQFTDLPHYSGPEVTFQIKIFESTSNIEVHYLNAPSNGDDHLAGIENQDGSDGVTYYFGEESLPPETAVQYALWQYVAPDVTVTNSNFDYTQPVTFDGALYCNITQDNGVCDFASFNAPAFCQANALYCDLNTFEIDGIALCANRPGYPGCVSQSYGVGLEILTHGDATITDISASGNGLSGLIIGDLENRADNVFIDPSVFNNNGFGSFSNKAAQLCIPPFCSDHPSNGGLEVYAHGDVVLDQVTASGNAGFGAYVDNTFGFGNIIPCSGGFCKTIAQAVNFENGNSAGNVSIFDSVFQGNGAPHVLGPVGLAVRNTGPFWSGRDGLMVKSFGDVTLLGVNASQNFGNGATLGCIFAESGCPSSVQVAQSIFNANGFALPQLDPNDPLFHQNLLMASAMQDGLVIGAAGNVLVTEVSASGNAGNGLAVGIFDGLFNIPNGNVQLGPPTIFINNSQASFDDNGLNGILLFTPYEAYLAYVNALRNAYYGIFAPAAPDLFGLGIGVPGPALVDLLCVQRSGNVADLFVDGPVVDHGCGDAGGDNQGDIGGGGGIIEGDDFVIVPDTPSGPLLIPVTGIGGTLLDQLGTDMGLGTIDDGEELDDLLELIGGVAESESAQMGLGWTFIRTPENALVALPEGSGDSVTATDIGVNDLTNDQYLGLPGGEVVLGGVQVDVTVNGSSVVELPSEGMIVSIPIPEGIPPGLTFTIKVWDPLLGWLSLETIVSPDGYAVATTPFAGTFILTASELVE